MSPMRRGAPPRRPRAQAPRVVLPVEVAGGAAATSDASASGRDISGADAPPAASDAPADGGGGLLPPIVQAPAVVTDDATQMLELQGLGGGGGGGDGGGGGGAGGGGGGGDDGGVLPDELVPRPRIPRTPLAASASAGFGGGARPLAGGVSRGRHDARGVQVAAARVAGRLLRG